MVLHRRMSRDSGSRIRNLRDPDVVYRRGRLVQAERQVSFLVGVLVGLLIAFWMIGRK